MVDKKHTKKYYKPDLQQQCDDRGISYKQNDTKSDLIKKLKGNYRSEESQGLFLGTQDKTTGKNPNSITSYFLQIKYENLLNYFNAGCIYPLGLEPSDIYKNENRKRDTLNLSEGHIIMGLGPIEDFESSDALVELIINEDEIKEVPEANHYFSSEPIPISRVRRIYFKDDQAKKNFIAQSKTYSDCFIPESLCEVGSHKIEPSKADTKKLSELPENNLQEWKQKLKSFNKLLGMLAFMKNASILQSESNNFLQTYTNGIFEVLYHINPVKEVEPESTKSGLNYILDLPGEGKRNEVRGAFFKKLVDEVYSNESEFSIERAQEMINQSIPDPVKDRAKNNEDLDLLKIQRLFKDYSKEDISYKEILKDEAFKSQKPAVKVLLLLAKFSKSSQGGSGNEEVRNAFIQGSIFPESLSEQEFLLGTLGFYYGYDSLPKADTNLTFSDSNFDRPAQEEQSIKFKLDTYLDRFIVESAFQFSKGKRGDSDKFEFLNWESRHDNSLDHIEPKETEGYYYHDETFKVLGKKVIRVRREDAKWALVNKISNDDRLSRFSSDSYLSHSLLKKMSTKDLISLLKNKIEKYSEEELRKVIELDNLGK